VEVVFALQRAYGGVGQILEDYIKDELLKAVLNGDEDNGDGNSQGDGSNSQGCAPLPVSDVPGCYGKFEYWFRLPGKVATSGKVIMLICYQGSETFLLLLIFI
jgi:hypothetical protein